MATAAGFNTYVRDNLTYLYDYKMWRTAPRSFWNYGGTGRTIHVTGTPAIYQNTSGCTRIVVISVRTDASWGRGYLRFLTDSSSPPTTPTGSIDITAGACSDIGFCITALVPNNWYYCLHRESGAGETILEWSEFDLGGTAITSGWTAPRTWVAHEHVHTDTMNEQTCDNTFHLYANMCDQAVSLTSWGFNGSNRKAETTYQNTSGLARLVVISLRLNADAYVRLYVDSSAPLSYMSGTLDTSLAGLGDTIGAVITSVVPPSWYYYLHAESGTINTILDWTEFALGL
jgi:hypothetical protein